MPRKRKSEQSAPAEPPAATAVPTDLLAPAAAVSDGVLPPLSSVAKQPPLRTRRELAKVLGVHVETVVKWERAGLPCAQRGGNGRASLYRESDVRTWLESRRETAKDNGQAQATHARASRDHWQAQLAEQMYRMRQGELLPREEVERAWANEIAAVRTKLLVLPSTLADRLVIVAATDGGAGVERILSDAVRDVLKELSDPARQILADSGSSLESAPA